MNNNTQKITFLDLFAGIGGFSLGLELAGMICKAQVEIDPWARKVLAKHWPNIRRFEDVRKVGRHNLPAVDLICGGPPCQPFSQMGKREGTADNRHLWPEMFRVTKEIRPRFVIIENVLGIKEMVLDRICADMESEKYEVWPFVLPAYAVDAKHRRYRFFIVAHSSRLEWDSIKAQRAKADTEARETKVPTRRYSVVERGRTGGSWLPEPRLARVATGVCARLDRFRKRRARGIGNSIVPQLAEAIGRLIVEANE